MPSRRMRAARRRLQAEDRQRERRLAAAGFADEAEALALLELEIDAVDGVQQRDRLPAEKCPPTVKMDREILDLEDRQRAQP